MENFTKQDIRKYVEYELNRMFVANKYLVIDNYRRFGIDGDVDLLVLKNVLEDVESEFEGFIEDHELSEIEFDNIVQTWKKNQQWKKFNKTDKLAYLTESGINAKLHKINF